MDSSSAVTGGGEPTHLNSNGLCLLSLDGGGVRGLSTLYILKALMDRLNQNRKALPRLRPCDIFDLIGGTSTGGLIAIMLGRLEMDVDACIEEYIGLMKDIFETKNSKLPFSLMTGKTKSQFDSSRLKAAIAGVINRHGAQETDLLNDGTERGCRIFVCTIAYETKDVVRLRSYNTNKLSVQATILEAALATSAAIAFFDPVKIGARKFADGGLGTNNPVEEVQEEASNIWCSETGDLKPLVKCIVSVGTGNPGKKAIEDKMPKFLAGTLVDLITETERTEKRFSFNWRKHFDDKRYFRFNVDQGLQNVDLAEYNDQGVIFAATDGYLDHQGQESRLRDCVQNLKLKQNMTDLSFAGDISEYTMRLNLQHHNIPRKSLFIFLITIFVVVIAHLGTSAWITTSVSPPRHRKPVNMHWIVPRPLNSLFTGRSDVLDRIQASFRVGEHSNAAKQNRLVITGMGGIGKSEVSLMAASLMRDSFWGVFWVDVSSPSTAEHDFHNIAEALRLANGSITVTCQALANMKNRWLLVLDNADDPTFDYAQYIPSGSGGSVILTSRVPECRKYSTISTVVLEGLDVDNSTQLLLKAADVAEVSWPYYKTQAQGIVELLGAHPLAIIQAGAYIAEGYSQLDQYAEKYADQRKHLLEHYPMQQQSRYQHVYATFEASLQVIAQSNDEVGRDAIELLGILSMLHSSVLPFAFFESAWREAIINKAAQKDEELDWGYHLSHLPGFLDIQEDKWDDRRLRKATALLASLSLVTRHQLPNLEGLSMHPLAHAWAKDRMADEEQQVTWLRAGDLLSLSLDQCHLLSPLRRQLLPHLLWLLSLRVEDIIDWVEPVSCFMVLVHCGRSLHAMHEDEILRRLLGDMETLLTTIPLNSWHLNVMLELGTHNSERTGNITARIRTLDLMIKTYGAVAPPNSRRYLSWKQQLGAAYYENNQIVEAIELQEEVAELATVYPENDMHILSWQLELAMSYRQNGQWSRSTELLEHVDRTLATLAAHDLDLYAQRLQRHLANSYIESGFMAKAIALLEYAGTTSTVVQSTEGLPSLLLTQKELARAYLYNKQVRKAVGLLEHIVEVYKSTLAREETDHDLLTAQHELSKAYRANGQPTMGVKLQEHVVAILEATRAGDHPALLAAQTALASMHLEDKQTTKGIALLEHIIRLKKNALPEDHPYVVQAQYELALAYDIDGQLSKAIELMQHVVDIRKATLEPDHPRRSQAERMLAGMQNMSWDEYFMWLLGSRPVIEYQWTRNA